MYPGKGKQRWKKKSPETELGIPDAAYCCRKSPMAKRPNLLDNNEADLGGKKLERKNKGSVCG